MRLEWRAFPNLPPFGDGAYLTVPELHRAGIKVAFTTRLGGASRGDLASLNLSLKADDSPEIVDRNRRRALTAVGERDAGWSGAEQVHGNQVAEIDEACELTKGVDALVTSRPKTPVAVLSADCVPVLIADRAASRVAVAHAGWRGALSGVIEAACSKFEKSADLVAAIGPSIGPCCYEVSAEIRDKATDKYGNHVAVGNNLDLWAVSRAALSASGVKAVASSRLCTRCNSHRLFSHRGGSTGRQGLIAAIA